MQCSSAFAVTGCSLHVACALVAVAAQCYASVPCIMTAGTCDGTARERAERAEQKRQDEADKAWRRLLRAVFTRVRVAADYAEDGSGAGMHCFHFCCE